MPYLRTIIDKNQLEEKPAPIKPVINVPPHIPTTYRYSDVKGGLLSTKNLTASEKGEKYEDYVGSLYKELNYHVIHEGRLKHRWDGSIDLICQYEIYTTLVQCKYYDRPNARIDVTDIYKFYGAVKYYSLKHLKEVVIGAFWTSLQGNSCAKAHDIATDLGIFFYEGVFIYERQ